MIADPSMTRVNNDSGIFYNGSLGVIGGRVMER
jgi:hypothetical protein